MIDWYYEIIITNSYSVKFITGSEVRRFVTENKNKMSKLWCVYDKHGKDVTKEFKL